MSTQNTAQDFGEPWETNCQSIYDRKGPLYFSAPTPELASRLVQCVNACRGMTDPAAEIEAMRAERDEMRKSLETFWEALPERLRQEEENKAMRAAIMGAHSYLEECSRWLPGDVVEVLAKLAPFLP